MQWIVIKNKLRAFRIRFYSEKKINRILSDKNKIESIDYLLLEIKDIARRLDFTNYCEIEKRLKEIKEILKSK